MTIEALGKSLLVSATALGILSIPGPPALAQGFNEVGAGWSAIPSASKSGDYRFSSGPYFRGAIGRSLNNRVRLRFDANVMIFRLQQQFPVPCPSTGCPNPVYDAHRLIRGTTAVTASGLLGLDPRQTFYLIGGGGLYNAETQVNSFHVGALAGVGIAVPLRSHHRAIMEVVWHGLAPKTNGPTWLIPVSLGYRF